MGSSRIEVKESGDSSAVEIEEQKKTWRVRQFGQRGRISVNGEVL